jgi:hypothetical protein
MMPDDTSAQANPFTPTERRPMRIMHLVNHCGKANGHVNVSIDLACTQAKMGHTVGYVCETGDYIDLLKSYGVTVFNAPEPHRSVLGFLRANVALARAIRKFRPDILHSHMAAQTVLLQPYRVLGYHVVTTLHNEFDRSARLMGMAGRVVAVGRTFVSGGNADAAGTSDDLWNASTKGRDRSARGVCLGRGTVSDVRTLSGGGGADVGGV